MLKSLSNRPNVQSTLILSRKDGSIIRATGFSQGDTAIDYQTRTYGKPQSNEANSPIQNMKEATRDSDDVANKRETPSSTELLAGAIYDFVNVSSRLAKDITNLEMHSVTNTSLSTDTQAREQQTESPSSSNEEDVHLLRMRTKRHEIIIFPDPNYLCCVIQKLSKATGRNDPI